PNPAYFPALSEDGTTLVTGEKAGNVSVWDASTGAKRATIRAGAIGHRGSEPHVSPDGKTIATESTGGVATTAVAFWNAATGRPLSNLPGHQSAITATAFAPGGKTAYTVGKDRTLRTWDPTTGRELARAE